jgi:hypothetical protein
VCFSFILTATLLANLTRVDISRPNLLWVSNGLPLAYLLLSPRWRWRPYLVVSYAAIILSSALIHEQWRVNLTFNTLGILKVWAIAPGPTHINEPVLLYAKRGDAVRRGHEQSLEVFF